MWTLNLTTQFKKDLKRYQKNAPKLAALKEVLIIIVLILLPTFLLILPIWWPIAWILGQVFPRRNFLPIRKILHHLRSRTINLLDINP